MNLIWIILAALSLCTILWIVWKSHRRIKKNNPMDTFVKQFNCPHPYDYKSNGKRICTACGKVLPPKHQEDPSWPHL